MLERLDEDLGRMIKQRQLTRISGIGPALAAVIEELYLTGESALLERLRAELPPGVVELSDIPGLSLKKIVALHNALGIGSVAELRAACEKGLVRRIKGFGEKTEAKILQAIQERETRPEQSLLHRALAESERLLAYLRADATVTQAEAAGALRRRRELVSRIRLVAASREPQAVVQYFSRLPGAAVTGMTRDACQIRLANGLPVDLVTVDPEHFANSLHYFTGSQKHRARLEEIAASKGLSFEPQGLRPNNGKKVSIQTEEDIYRHLSMQYVPPELREDTGEIEAALSGALPGLVNEEEIRGVVHCHTVYSDGKNTIEEMARAADRLGMRYLTITDHSPSAFYARGVKIDRLKAQWDEIARVQEQSRVKLLRGTESDILDDGALDYPDAVLEKFEVIIASIHVRSGMGPGPMTRRLVQAMKWPFVKIWGHPLGRLLLSRAPLECAVEEVLDAVAASPALIEVNGDPRRLDLEPRWIRVARERGIKFVVSSDAHSVDTLQNFRYGVAMARRGWLRRADVVNTMDTDDFMNAVRPLQTQRAKS